MLQTLIRFLRPPNFETDPAKTRTAGVTYWLVITFLALSVFGSVFSAITSPEITVYVIASVIVWAICLVVNRAGYVQVVNIVLVVYNLMILTFVAITGGGEKGLGIFTLLLTIVVSMLVLPRFGTLIVAAVSIVIVGIIYASENLWGLLQYPEQTPSAGDGWVMYGILALFSGIILEIEKRLSSHAIEVARTSEQRLSAKQAELERKNEDLQNMTVEMQKLVEERTSELQVANEKASKRASQLKTITDLASTIAGVRSLDVLLGTITGTISQELGYYHVGIFIISDDGSYAHLAAANSEGGQRMLERGHRLAVGKQGLVGNVASSGKARIALDVGTDATYFNNPDLPNTHSEIALPLTVSRNVIGVLDVQSEDSNAFSEDDIDVLGTLASQVAIAIENAKLYDQTTRALEEAEQIYQQYIRQEWKQAIGSQPVRGYRYSSLRVKPIKQQDAPTQGTKDTFVIPVKLRGQVIGRLGLRKDIENLSQDEIAILEAAAERAALALENARLIEDTLKRATQERLMSEISSKIGASMRFENILRTTAEELSRALNGSEVLVQLQPDALEKG